MPSGHFRDVGYFLATATVLGSSCCQKSLDADYAEFCWLLVVFDSRLCHKASVHVAVRFGSTALPISRICNDDGTTVGLGRSFVADW